MRYPLFFNKALFAFIRLMDWPFSFLSRRLGSSYQIIVPSNTYAPWVKDQDFQKIFWGNKKHSLINIYQAWELWKTVENTSQVPGDILEVGVWRGSTSIIMGSKLKQINASKTIFACDTFEGVVKAGNHKDNFYKGGEHNDTSLEFTRTRIAAHQLSNITLRKGIFPEQTGHLIADRTFSLCHIDVDAFDSGKDILEWVWLRMNIGGVVIFSDYGFPLTRGITLLVDEQTAYDDRLVLHNLNGNGIIIKIK
jgi:O-methyltransferase